MCPDCISVIAVAVVAATPLSVVKAFLSRKAERVLAPRKTQFASVQQKESVRHDHQPD
jgi:hypothetical protein